MTDESVKTSTPSPAGTPSETSDPYHHPADQSFVLQYMIDVQKSIGELTKAVSKLEESADSQRDELRKIRTTIAAAAGALTVILVVGSFLINKIWDRVVTVLAGATPS